MGKNKTNRHSDSYFPTKTGAAANDWKGWVGFEALNADTVDFTLGGHCPAFSTRLTTANDGVIDYLVPAAETASTTCPGAPDVPHMFMRAGVKVQNEFNTSGSVLPLGIGFMQTVSVWGFANPGDMLFFQSERGPTVLSPGALVTARRVCNGTDYGHLICLCAAAIAATAFSGGDINSGKALVLPWIV